MENSLRALLEQPRQLLLIAVAAVAATLIGSELFALLRPFWPIVALSIVLGMVGGLSVTALLASINTALHSDGNITSTAIAALAVGPSIGIGG